MISAPSTMVALKTSAIRSHDDLATPFDRPLWGPTAIMV